MTSKTSQLYIGKSTIFKVFLLLGIVAISVFFILYTFRMIDTLKEQTRAQVEKYVQLWQLAINSPGSGAELQFIFDEIIVKATFPIIVLDNKGVPVQWRNVPEISPDDSSEAVIVRLTDMSDKMKLEGHIFPIYFGTTLINHLCYGDPDVIAKLQVMPFIEIGVVLAFLLVGMIGLQNIQKSEERLIWVGMAKETAHQLGTPITSLLGWLELIGPEQRVGIESGKLNIMLDSTVENMAVDVKRLERVANRFGLIGSIPELQLGNVNMLVTECAEYYRRRLPFEGEGIKIDCQLDVVPEVRLNAELFSWALENLIKNGLQAVDVKSGRMILFTEHDKESRMVRIEVIDNGGGISTAAARKIFRPGFTTKKRGWGMGLTLVKRIIEEYHAGKISLKRTRPGETVFEILLPVPTTPGSIS